MPAVKVQIARQWFSFGSPATIDQTVANIRAVMEQRERMLREDQRTIEKLMAAREKLEADIAAEKARKAEQRRAKRSER